MRITDKMRLDWLDSDKSGNVSFTHQMSGGIYVWDDLGTVEVPDNGKFFKSLRLAIDAAIRASRRQDGRKVRR